MPLATSTAATKSTGSTRATDSGSSSVMLLRAKPVRSKWPVMLMSSAPCIYHNIVSLVFRFASEEYSRFRHPLGELDHRPALPFLMVSSDVGAKTLHFCWHSHCSGPRQLVRRRGEMSGRLTDSESNGGVCWLTPIQRRRACVCERSAT